MPPRRDAHRFVPIVLAAGGSTRMGQPKAALRFGATTALGRVLATCDAVGLAPAVIVAGAHPEAVEQACAEYVRDRSSAGGAPANHRVVHNPDWATGRTTSIQAGVAALDPSAEGFLLWPVDVCLPGRPVVASLLSAAGTHPEPSTLAWVPSLEGRRGHPILFAAAVAARLAALGPDQPARAVTRALDAQGALQHLIVADRTVVMEMNTPEGYQRWLASDEAARDC